MPVRAIHYGHASTTSEKPSLSRVPIRMKCLFALEKRKDAKAPLPYKIFRPTAGAICESPASGKAKSTPRGSYHKAGFELPNKEKGVRTISLLFQAENLKAQKVGRELVFSADMCYTGANEKPLPLGEVAAKPTERVRLWNETPSHPLSRELSQRESLKTCATLGVWALPAAFVIQRRNWR